MVNDASIFGIDPARGDPARRLALGYAPADARAGVAALFALDATLAQVLRTTTQPVIGQIRLAWWREALERLDHAPPPAQPILATLAHDVAGRATSGAMLAEIVEGWEALLADPADRAGAIRRGEALFGAAGAVLGAGRDPVTPAGRGWALADLPDAQGAARTALDAAMAHRWTPRGRALGALALAARAGLDGPAGPGLVPRMLAHRLTGR